jgi:hypothetical protein
LEASKVNKHCSGKEGDKLIVGMTELKPLKQANVLCNHSSLFCVASLLILAQSSLDAAGKERLLFAEQLDIPERITMNDENSSSVSTFCALKCGFLRKRS